MRLKHIRSVSAAGDVDKVPGVSTEHGWFRAMALIPDGMNAAADTSQWCRAMAEYVPATSTTWRVVCCPQHT
jgi:hypothetical protein